MQVQVKVPQVGESITHGTLVEWHAAAGARVSAGDDLFELETDKVTLTVQAEAAGTLAIAVPEGQRVAVGDVVATLDTEGAAFAEPPAPPLAPPADVPPALAPAAPPISPPAGFPQAEAKLAALGELRPSVRRLVEEHALDPAALAASGPGGRVTKDDVLAHLAAPPAPPAPLAPPTPPAPTAAPVTDAPAPTPAPTAPAGTERAATRTKMTTLRQRIAERLVLAQSTAAMLTTFNELDMSGVMALREALKDDFEAKHGVKLGFMSFFVKAAVDALKRFPIVNARIEGDEIVQPSYHDVGVAVSTDAGLVVPVLRDADRRSFAEIEKEIADLARKARDRKLSLADLTGGTFSITNGGIYGSLMSTPILNPPQSAILGMHGIKKRPVVVDDQIVIRPMMYVALSYDHRLVDGRDAVGFLKRIVQCVERPERLLLDA
jgi:2-oxoglutarate dehydrogenase E2 component (dihydrolipoamide succinyltransferase)